ncbi:MAG: hypothetical protein H6587_00455 [Flavobacteriales bacterium]|nr:hypothetical protein [Flavobacteriales bacterium]MCB9363016.1 hypothetical protein [Flavobacteriales bacterium]
MIKSLYLSVLLSIISLSGFSQLLTKTLSGNQFTTDQFGNFYDISSREIKKYNIKGELMFSYSNNILGEISSVDASNPLKVLVYFKDFTKVLTLDDALSPRGDVLNLNDLSLEETSLVCRSYNNGVWFYNPIKYQLTRLENRNVVNISSNLSNLLGENIQPNHLVEASEKVYLSDTKHGVLVFDVYGTYLKTIPIYNAKAIQVKQKYILYVNTKNEIEIYNVFTLEKSLYQPEKFNNVKSVRIEGSNIYVLTLKNQLIIDKIQL